MESKLIRCVEKGERGSVGGDQVEWLMEYCSKQDAVRSWVDGQKGRRALLLFTPPLILLVLILLSLS